MPSRVVWGCFEERGSSFYCFGHVGVSTGGTPPHNSAASLAINFKQTLKVYFSRKLTVIIIAPQLAIMADTSAAKFVGPMSLASCADVEQQSTESLLQGLLSRSPMLDSPSHNMGPLSLSPHPVSESNACRLQSGQLLSVPGASKFALAAASPVTLNVSAGRGPEKLHETDPDELTSRKPVRTPTELQLRGLSLSDASDDSRETGLVLLAPPTPVSKTAILAHRPTRNCDCRDYWPRIDEKNMSVRRAVGPGHKAPSQVRSVVCDDFLSQLVPMMPSSKGSKKVRAGNTVRSLPGDLVEVLRLGNDAQGRPTPCKPAHSRGSSCSSTPSAGPRPLTLQQLSSFGGSLASHSGTTFTKSSVSAWSPPSSASVSLDEPAQVTFLSDVFIIYDPQVLYHDGGRNGGFCCCSWYLQS